VQAQQKTQISFPQRTSEGIDVEKTISNPLQNQLASQFHWPFGNCHLSFRHFLPSHCPQLFGTGVRPLAWKQPKPRPEDIWLCFESTLGETENAKAFSLIRGMP